MLQYLIENIDKYESDVQTSISILVECICIKTICKDCKRDCTIKESDYYELTKRFLVRMDWYRNPKDKCGKRRGGIGYNPKQLYIPKWVWKHLTVFQQIYWTIKSDHFDVVVLFKLGKNYYLYNKDAEIANQLFGLKIHVTCAEIIEKCVFFDPKFGKRYINIFNEHNYSIYQASITNVDVKTVDHEIEDSDDSKNNINEDVRLKMIQNSKKRFIDAALHLWPSKLYILRFATTRLIDISRHFQRYDCSINNPNCNLHCCDVELDFWIRSDDCDLMIIASHLVNVFLILLIS